MLCNNYEASMLTVLRGSSVTSKPDVTAILGVSDDGHLFKLANKKSVVECNLPCGRQTTPPVSLFYRYGS